MKKAKRKETKDKKKGKDAIVVPEGWVSPFGTTLQQQARANENGWFEIPFVELCIPFLLERGLQSEGIFRISGGVASLQRLQSAFERGTNTYFASVFTSCTLGEKTTFTTTDDPFDVACLLKVKSDWKSLLNFLLDLPAKLT
jgi:hypothetical protein